MKKYLFLSFFVAISTVLTGQTKTAFTISKKGFLTPRDAVHTDWNILLENLEAPMPGGDSYREFLLSKKEEIEKKYPRHGNVSSTRSITNQDTIGVGMSFLTNVNGHGVPNDNSMAISNDGILLSAFNSAVFIYDTEADTLIAEVSLNFFRDQLGYTASSYDPKLVYDPDNDRFILVFLVGKLAADSKIVTCFSTSNNPMDPWNVYSVPGNPLNDTSWSDYPAISITKGDLFITMNLLRENQSWQTAFKQTVIWQINKEEGYLGDTTIQMDLYSGIQEGGIPIRNLHPVTGGMDIKGPNQYFLSNRNFADQSDTLYFLQVTNSKKSNQAQLTIQLLKTDQNYYLSPSARQIQSSLKKFQTNDSRVLGAILENNRIEFVQNSLHPASGNSAVYHGVIDNVNAPTVRTRFIYDDSLEYGYPNIVYASSFPNETKSMIGFNHTSLWHLPGHSAVYFDGENFSEVKMVKEGEGYVSAQFGTFQRWGDYLGMQRKYNDPCVVWMTGYFGGSNQINYSWASQLYTPNDCFIEQEKVKQQNGNVFPNPTVDVTEIHFNLEESKYITIDLIDNYGNLVKRLLQDVANAGDNRLTFSMQQITSGIYFIRINSNKENILLKKIVKR